MLPVGRDWAVDICQPVGHDPITEDGAAVVEIGSVSAGSLRQRSGDVKERSAGSDGVDVVNSEAWV